MSASFRALHSALSVGRKRMCNYWECHNFPGSHISIRTVNLSRVYSTNNKKVEKNGIRTMAQEKSLKDIDKCNKITNSWSIEDSDAPSLSAIESSRILETSDIKSLDKLIRSAAGKKDKEKHIACLALKVKVYWKLGKESDALSLLKYLYSGVNKLQAKREVRKTFSYLCSVNTTSQESTTHLSEFARWCRESKHDFKPSSVIWSKLLCNEESFLRKDGIALYDVCGTNMVKYLPKRIEALLRNLESLQEEIILHLLDVSTRLHLDSFTSQLYGELVIRSCRHGEDEKAETLISKAAAEGATIPPHVLNTYFDCLQKEKKLIPLHLLAMKPTKEGPSDEPKLLTIEVQAARKMVQSFSSQKCPPFETGLKVVRTLAEVGDIESVQTVIKAVETGHSYRFRKDGEMRRFVAEALWKSGRRTEALQCLKEACMKFRGQNQVVRRLRNAFIICVLKTNCYAVSEVIAMAEWFAESLADYKPVTVIWKHLVASSSFSDYELGTRLFSSHSEGMQDEISMIFDDFAKQPPSEEVLRRFIDAALPLNRRNDLKALYSLLLDTLCKKNNDLLADEVLCSAAGLGIEISSDSLSRYQEMKKSSFVTMSLPKEPDLNPPTYPLKF